jgi:hypothetical protein
MTLKNLLGISLDAVAADKGSLSVSLPQSKVIVLDALRKQRNLADYSGELVTEAAVVECVASAKELLAHVRTWVMANRPDLLLR